MKKFTKVLLALLLALTMAFVFAACGDDSSDDDGDGDEGGNPPSGSNVVLLDLAAHLATLDADEAIFGVILPGTKGFQKAGGVTAELVDVGGTRGVKLAFSENWAGIDLLDSFFKFKAGDKIELKGKINAATDNGKGEDGAEFVIQDEPGAWGTPAYQQTGIEADTVLDVNVTLTSGMIGHIAAGDPKALRIQGNNVEADSLVLTLTQIKVSGRR